ncbi:MAG TPA: ABC transporter substrate-binding protein [Candidatus Acidoferrales bacterium]|nr:ABC transporter substrate-binding protein [Candidatus Acidoferrales bacterium]
MNLRSKAIFLRRVIYFSLIAGGAFLLNCEKAHAADKLVLLSPHWEGIRYEFERGFKRFYRDETGRDVEFEWLDVGGTSEMLRFIRSEFTSKPAGIGIDVIFGGGLDPYLVLESANLLEPYRLPEPLLSKIPPRLSGFHLYDPGYRWYGATLAGFGIVYNKVVLNLLKLPVIATWEGLALPAVFSWVGSADPRKSGSVHMMYEIILQAYGWEKGWQIITGLGANVRNFTGAASQVPKDVTIGEVAYGLAIDFYAWAQIDEAGADKIGFVMPENLTIINPDCIAILKGAPNRDVAQSFVRFVMSEPGQKLWLLPARSPAGPERYALNRFSVLPSLYGAAQGGAVKLNPFSWKSDFSFDSKLGSERWGIVNDLIGALIIDQKDMLARAWKAAIAGGLTDDEWQRLAAMPVSDREALEFARTRWRDPAFRNQKLNEWVQFARAKYGRDLKPPLIRSEWLSLFTFAVIALGIFVYSCKRSG